MFDSIVDDFEGLIKSLKKIIATIESRRDEISVDEILKLLKDVIEDD